MTTSEGTWDPAAVRPLPRWLDPTSPPHPWLLTPFEFPRAVVELGVGLLISPALVAVHGVGRHDHSGLRAPVHPVLVVPGLRGGNSWTVPLRSYLESLGHDVRVPEPDTMKAGREVVVRSLTKQLSKIARETGQPVSVVAWSIGGCFVRQAAALRPDTVRRVITLGTPIDGQIWYGREPAPRRLSVPTTAVYSRTDGIVGWRRCVLPAGPTSDNAEVVSSHFGMSTNPFALHVIGDRLSR